MSGVAARVARSKEEHPERYCPVHRCLWRTFNGQTGVFTPCGRHGLLHPDAAALMAAIEEEEYLATSPGHLLSEADEILN